ncbi:MAG: HI0074 family nucleotidyltransferase substrate-binding subunit [Candidatus Ornithomonoglobus sp.]
MNIKTDKVLNEIRRIALKYNINKLVLFGSRARGDNTQKSDYDIAVFANDIELSEQASFLDELEAVETLNKIDVVFIKKRHADTELYNNIMKDGAEIMNKFQIKLNNYTNALARLHESIEDSKKYDNLTFRDGVIQRFEFTAELAWETIREYLLSENVSDINTPKAVMREAFSADVINDEQGWIQILNDRNSTSHIYDEDDAAEIYERIISVHITLFDELLKKLS